MSREISRKIVEDIYSDTYVSLKEDVSKVISEKAVSVLEDMKSHVAKSFFLAGIPKPGERSVQGRNF